MEVAETETGVGMNVWGQKYEGLRLVCDDLLCKKGLIYRHKLIFSVALAKDQYLHVQKYIQEHDHHLCEVSEVRLRVLSHL